MEASRLVHRQDRWHEFHHHTAELELQVGAPTLAELFAEAGVALGELLRGEATAGELSVGRTVRVEGRDAEALLVAWLNELIFLAETALWVPFEVEILELSPSSLRARCRGRRIEEAPTLVKAATYHGLHIRQQEEGSVAEVILDV